MSCGVNIPLSSVVEAIVNDYADVFAKEIISRIDLNKFTKADGGSLKGVTLQDSVTLDEKAKQSLFNALQDLIGGKITAEIDKKPDNHVEKFYIDKTKDHLVIEMNGGERYYVSRAEFESWLKFATGGGSTAGGVQSGELIKQTADPKQVIRLTNKDNTNIDIDVSGLSDTKLERGELLNNTTLRLHTSDNGHIDTDLSGLQGTTISRGEFINGDTLRLHLSNGSHVDTQITLPAQANSPYINSGTLNKRDNGYWLDFKRNDDQFVSIDMTPHINEIIKIVYDKVMDTGYRINTQADDYALVGDDFNGRTLVRADKDGDQTITIAKPPTETFVGKSIILRKTKGAVGTFVNLVAGAGVTLIPDDVTPVRRVGSSVTLVYIGDGVYDVFGELP